jgi:tRNA (cmo5U34)-methyltransferase
LEAVGDRVRQVGSTRDSIFAPEEDEKHLRDAGFGDVSLFYVGFTFRGWVAYAA